MRTACPDCGAAFVATAVVKRSRRRNGYLNHARRCRGDQGKRAQTALADDMANLEVEVFA